MHICFFSPAYPTKDISVYPFVKQIVEELADSGIRCTVISPLSITRLFFSNGNKMNLQPYFRQENTKKGNIIDVYQPKYISLSEVKFLGFNISYVFRMICAKNCFNRLKDKPDVLYSEFWHEAILAATIGSKQKIPVFVDSGESKIIVRNYFPQKFIKKYKNFIKAAICVSSKNMEESLSLKLISDDKICVIPNGIDNDKFYQISKIESRKALNFPQDIFIVAYLGAFDHRKGIARVSDALNKFDDVFSIIIGSGSIKTNCGNILFKGRLRHEEIVHYLCCADVFLLPTLAEGCCNAIIEAMACGLPVISSNLNFNDDILDDTCSLRINPEDIEMIADSIRLLKNNHDLRRSLQIGALKRAMELQIGVRASKIINYIGSHTENNNETKLL